MDPKQKPRKSFKGQVKKLSQWSEKPDRKLGRQSK